MESLIKTQFEVKQLISEQYPLTSRVSLKLENDLDAHSERYSNAASQTTHLKTHQNSSGRPTISMSTTTHIN